MADLMLQHKVTFAEPTGANDSFGGASTAWTDRITVRAHIKYLRGGEAVQASRLEGRQPVVTTVRASTDTKKITPAWKMTNARTNEEYEISAIVLSDDRCWYEITARSGVHI